MISSVMHSTYYDQVGSCQHAVLMSVWGGGGGVYMDEASFK